MNDKFNLVCFDEIFLKHSWNWFQDQELRAKTDTPVFSKEQQLNWYNSLRNNSSYFIWGILFEKIPIGACGIKNCNKRQGEIWGYIGEKSYRGKGIGLYMFSETERKAREMGLQKLVLNVLKINTTAKKLYDKMGYLVEKEYMDSLCMSKNIGPHDKIS